MAYSPTAWINNSEPAITAEKLNKMEFGIASSHGIAEAKASTDYVQGQIAVEVQARIDYVTNTFGAYEAQINAYIASALNKYDDVTDERIQLLLQDITSLTYITVTSLIDQVVTDETGDTYASIQQFALSAAEEEWALNYLTTTINTVLGDESGALSQSSIEEKIKSSVDSEWALTTLTTNLTTAFGENASTIDTAIKSVVDSEWSLNTLTTNLESTFGTNASTIDTAITTSVDNNFSLSTIKTNLESKFGPNAAAIETKLGTYANNDDVGAIAQVALDVNGRITGWTAVDSTVSGSSFLIQADKFAITDQTRSAYPFSIDTTTGDIQFNGKVTFGKTNTTPELQADLAGTDGVNGTDGSDGVNGTDGSDGVNGKSAYELWISQGNTGSNDVFLAALAGEDGINGSDGLPGENGIDGTTTYTWIKYADDSSGNGLTNTSTDKKYIGFAYNRETEDESDIPTYYVWSLIKGADGVDGTDGSEGKSTYQSYVDTGGTLSEADWISQQATQDDIASAIANDTTVIDGSRITTGSLSALSADLGTINAGIIYGGAGLVAGNEEATHSMKIDLTNGSIYIA